MAEVLVCGSTAVDFVFDVDAFPVAAEKYRASNAAIVGGGCAANAAVAIARLGGRPRLAARLARDLIGRMTAEELAHEGVDLTAVQWTDSGRSAFSSILVDPAGERQIVAFRGDGLARDLPAEALGRPDAVLADTRWPEGAATALAHARALGVPGVLDAEAPVTEAVAELASHVAFSTQGLREFTGETDPVAGLKAAAARLPGWVCVTNGAEGTLVLDRGDLRRVPTLAVAAVDTLGAGDVWHGAFALALAERRPLIHAVRFANAAAALKCTRPGGRRGAPGRSETEDSLQRIPQ